MSVFAARVHSPCFGRLTHLHLPEPEQVPGFLYSALSRVSRREDLFIAGGRAADALIRLCQETRHFVEVFTAKGGKQYVKRAGDTFGSCGRFEYPLS